MSGISIRTKIKLPVSYEEAFKTLEASERAFRKANPDLFVNTED